METNEVFVLMFKQGNVLASFEAYGTRKDAIIAARRLGKRYGDGHKPYIVSFIRSLKVVRMPVVRGLRRRRRKGN